MSRWPLQFMALQFGVELPAGRNAGRRNGARIDSEDQRQDALALCEEWNRRLAAGVDPQYSPSIGCAIHAGRPYLRLLCTGCRQYADLDLRTIVRPASFPITGIYDALVCSYGRCRGDSRRPQLSGWPQERDNILRELEAERARR